MKNILDTLGGALGKGGLGNTLGDTLGKLGGSGGLGSVGDTLNSAMGKAKESAASTPTDKLNLGGMLGSAAIGGLLGALFGGKGVGKTVGKVAKGALVVGGTAAAGALAWKFYQKWSQSQVTAETVSVPGQAPSAQIPPSQQQTTPSGWPTALQQETQAALPPAENTALLLLEAMIFAARADGHIDEEEKAHIQNAVTALFPGQEINALLEHMLTKPIDPAALAARIHNHEEARDLYRLSCTAVHVDNFMERSYLDGLAQALHISTPEKEQLEREAEEARREAAQA